MQVPDHSVFRQNDLALLATHISTVKGRNRKLVYRQSCADAVNTALVRRDIDIRLIGLRVSPQISCYRYACSLFIELQDVGFSVPSSSVTLDTAEDLTMFVRSKTAAFGGMLLAIGTLAQDDFKCTGSGNITEYHAKIKNLGCWTDSTTRTLSGKSSSSALNSPQYCADYCGNMGFKYSGVRIHHVHFLPLQDKPSNRANVLLANATAATQSTPSPTKPPAQAAMTPVLETLQRSAVARTL